VSPRDDRADGFGHRFDPGAMLAGLFFLSAAAWFATAALTAYDVPVAIAVPTLLFGFAVIGFVRVATRSRRR
jgi:hypothetical protein